MCLGLQLPEENSPTTSGHGNSFSQTAYDQVTGRPLEKDELEDWVKSSNTMCHLAETL